MPTLKVLFPGSYVPDDILVGRLTPDGQFDASFAGRGFTLTDFDGGRDRPVALLSQGKAGILLVGQSDYSGRSFERLAVLARYEGIPQFPWLRNP